MMMMLENINASDPALISQTIAHLPPTPTKEISERSRFVNE